MGTSNNKSAIKDRALRAIQGVDKRFANVASVTLRNGAYTPAEMKTLLKSAVDLANAADGAKAAWLAVVKQGIAARKAALALLRALQSYLVATSGGDEVAVLADFGMTPPKPRKVTVKAKAVAIEKSATTRALRRTMGSKQKKSVKAGAATPAPATTPVGTK
jgi:hypothetical protein